MRTLPTTERLAVSISPLDQEATEHQVLNDQGDHSSIHKDDQPTTLVDICLNLVFSNLIQLLTNINNSKQETYIAKEKLLLRLLDLFQKPQQIHECSEIIVPSLPSHLVKRLIRKYIEFVSLDVFDYGPDQLPLLLFISLSKIYLDLQVFGFRTKNSCLENCYHQLSLMENEIEIKLIQNYLQPTNCITIFDVTGQTTFNDSNLINLHHLIGRSVRSIVLDFTAVTDLGISHLTRTISHLSSDITHSSNTIEGNQQAFLGLNVIGLRGLGRITDRSAKQLILFPNLYLIDLTGTSCTDAIRLILNKLESIKDRRFHLPTSKTELELCTIDLKPCERLNKLLNWNENNKTTDTSRFFFHIYHQSYHKSNSQRLNLDPTSAFSIKFNKSVKTFWLVRQLSSSSNFTFHSEIKSRSRSATNLITLTNNNNNSDFDFVKIKRKKLNNDNRQILDDLMEVKKL